MKNVTRNYYVPRNQIGRHIINRIIEKVGCSVSDFKVNRETNTICVTLSYNEKDTPTIERVLKMYDVM
jgi:hypothetical protein